MNGRIDHRRFFPIFAYKEVMRRPYRRDARNSPCNSDFINLISTGYSWRCPQRMSTNEVSENDLKWYAVRVTYSREMVVKNYLDGCGVENYIPMHLAERIYNGQRRKVSEPLVHNLIFIRTSAERLREIKTGTVLPIRYIIDRETNSPTVIPDRQMQDFMTVIATHHQHVEVVPTESLDLRSGDRVRVTDGPFAGIEGRYIRHKGHSKVAVEVRNIATALTAYVPAKYVERLSDDAASAH